MAVTQVRNNDLNGALRRWKMDVQKNGALSKAKEKKEYKKPGVRRREEKKINTMNSRRNSRKNNY